MADGSDNFTTRDLSNDACYFAKKPLVSGALLRFEWRSGSFRTLKVKRDPACALCGVQPRIKGLHPIEPQ